MGTVGGSHSILGLVLSAMSAVLLVSFPELMCSLDVSVLETVKYVNRPSTVYPVVKILVSYAAYLS